MSRGRQTVTTPEPEPVVLVSSRDGAEVPRVAGALRLEAAAKRRGWAARSTYALADVPERHYLNGNIAKPAHRLASLVVRLARDDARAWAAWHRVDDGPWRFVCAYFGIESAGLRAGKLGRPVVDERLEAPR